ncbi:unnamed protein product [Ambrosiozyma monospora]|uniref:Unnamed protein product n=1 Tax=Ambrosiozyma monospora TaxID=43982 RepID=A0ACB5TDH0_AMBMO|nr:unnamed protein product [Ambrosiozyma monospora]
MLKTTTTIYGYYDWKTLRRIVRQLRQLRNEKRFDELKIVLQSCVKSNFAGTENPLLYSHCYYGTKRLIEVYNHEVCSSLQSIIDTDVISSSEKRTFFKVVTRNFGKTALALSGGASFTYLHYGVMKALLETDLMPKIISGTSGGGLCSALAATRTNEELLRLLTPKLAKNINACGDDPWYVWMYRWWRTGARFDPVDWARKAQWWTLGSTTFQECYERTGKTLNISTVPHDIHSPTILCNYLTSPNCCIWSTLLASAAVPGILPPVVLMEKSAGGSITPFSFGNRFKDGSMRTDIPIEALNTHFNVKFSIVSQVNPHVLLWFFKNKGDIGTPLSRRKGSSFRGGFISSYFENLIKLEIIKWMKLIREFQLLPNFMQSDWSNVFLQKFSGTITLFPKISLKDYRYILCDPTEERLAEMISSGQSVTYPKLLFIRHRLNIERLIEKGRNLTRDPVSHIFNANSTRSGTPDSIGNTLDSFKMNHRNGRYSIDDSSDEEYDYHRSDSDEMGFLGMQTKNLKPFYDIAEAGREADGSDIDELDPLEVSESASEIKKDQ